MKDLRLDQVIGLLVSITIIITGVNSSFLADKDNELLLAAITLLSFIGLAIGKPVLNKHFVILNLCFLLFLILIIITSFTSPNLFIYSRTPLGASASAITLAYFSTMNSTRFTLFWKGVSSSYCLLPLSIILYWLNYSVGLDSYNKAALAVFFVSFSHFILNEHVRTRKLIIRIVVSFLCVLSLFSAKFSIAVLILSSPLLIFLLYDLFRFSIKFLRTQKFTPLGLGLSSLFSLFFSASIVFVSNCGSLTSSAICLPFVTRVLLRLKLSLAYLGIINNSELSEQFITKFSENRLSWVDSVFSSDLTALGNGLEATRDFIGITTHNSFVDILYDYGLIGLIMFVASSLIWLALALRFLSSFVICAIQRKPLYNYHQSFFANPLDLSLILSPLAFFLLAFTGTFYSNPIFYMLFSTSIYLSCVRLFFLGRRYPVFLG